MITDITLENFKGFQQVEILPKQITAFVGPNGTGKSSVLQAFGLLKQTVEKLDDSHERGKEARDWEVEIVSQGPLVSLPSVESLSPKFRIRGSPELVLEGNLARSLRTPTLRRPFSYKVQFSRTVKVSPTPINNRPTPRPVAPVPMKELASTWKMVLAVRALAQPVYELGENLVEDIYSIADTWQQEAQAATNLVYSQIWTEKVSNMLKKVTGTGLRADPVPSKSVEVKSLGQAGLINIVAEGSGTNSLIMLLLQLATAERGATVMIEEPEIHLHPKAQAELASVLVEEALTGNKQVIMTTHSETILNRLLTLVVEGALPLDDLAIYAFEKDEETGVCSANPLKIDAGGRVEGGIKDFYAVNLAEMNRYVEAQFARIQASQ